MNIGVLIAKQITGFQINVLQHILDDSRFVIKLAVIDDKPTDKITRKLRRNVKHKRGGYIMLMAAQQLHSKSKSQPSEEFFRKQNIDVFKNQHYIFDQIHFNHRLLFFRCIGIIEWFWSDQKTVVT